MNLTRKRSDLDWLFSDKNPSKSVNSGRFEGKCLSVCLLSWQKSSIEAKYDVHFMHYYWYVMVLRRYSDTLCDNICVMSVGVYINSGVSIPYDQPPPVLRRRLT